MIYPDIYPVLIIYIELCLWVIVKIPSKIFDSLNMIKIFDGVMGT